ncbi:MAG: hypothetical protein HZA80_01550 [Candidatus Taylorbacteria bacterium]|nr:hypothetical protein [Candidatus Taylorbacteria bacterium]
MKKEITTLTFLIIVLIAISSGPYIFSDHETERTFVSSKPKCPYFEDYTKTETAYTYINTKLGYSIEIPKGWYVAPTDDNDPRMYNCDNVEGGSSFGIYTTYANAYYDYEKELATTKEKVYTDLIPGAIVIKHNMENLEHAPWGYIYTIVYKKEKKVFSLIVPGNIEESTVLPTLKLIQK